MLHLKRSNEMARGRGSCGGVRKFDGSGKGVGQKTKQKPKPKPRKKK